ncbi:MAG: serine/threonine-protein kinase [Planctomycetaceae bacterium]
MPSTSATGSDEVPISQLGRFKILQVLGCGGQSMALKAWDTELFRHVVIKVRHSFDSQAEQERMLFEGRALARVRHANVCKCLSVEWLGDFPYLVLQYIPGETLRERILRRRLTLPESVELSLTLCEAVAAIHDSGLLHCDLKPSNIVVNDTNEPTVVDLGLATSRLELTPAHTMGTPAYLAPERANGEIELIDERCDVFGIGAVLYELLTGQAPFAHQTSEGSRRLAREGIVRPATCGCSELQEVLMRSLARQPSDRFRDAREFRLALMKFDTRPAN